MNPWLLLGAAVVWALSLFAVGSWQNEAGRVAERVEWQAKDNTQLAAANAEIQRLNAAARQTERDYALRLFKIGEKHAQENDAAEKRRRADVNAARSGAIRLRVAGACPARPDPGGVGEAAAPASGGDEATTGELPREVAADLLDLAHDADQVVVQLTACQAVVTAYLGAIP